MPVTSKDIDRLLEPGSGPSIPSRPISDRNDSEPLEPELGRVDPTSQEALVEDELLDRALEEVEELTGTDYRMVFDSISWEDFQDPETEDAYGVTRYNPDPVAGHRVREDGQLNMAINSKFLEGKIDYRELLQTIEHEGIHGLVARGQYAEEMRRSGMPITSVMAHTAAVKSGNTALSEAAVENSARIRNPEYRGTDLSVYDGLVSGWNSLMEGLNAAMGVGERKALEGSSRFEDVDVKYVNADIGHYIEHGEIGDQDYIIALGNEEETSEYLGEIYEMYPEGEEPELFKYDSPFDPDQKEYRMPEMEDFQKFLENYSEQDEYNGYNPEGDGFEGGNPSYAEMVGKTPERPESGIDPRPDLTPGASFDYAEV